jgi:DNA primase
LADLFWETETAGRQFDTPERRSGLRQHLTNLAARIADRTVQEDYRLEFDRRLAEAFGYANRRSGGGGAAGVTDRRAGGGPKGGKGFGTGRGRGARYAPMAAERGGGALRQGIPDPERRQPEMLLSIAVSHPRIAHQRAEELAQLVLVDSQLDKLRQAIIDHAAGTPDLDVEGLKRHLVDAGFSGVLDALITRNKGLSVCRAEVELTAAEEAFDHLLGLMKERQARLEADLAAQRLGAEATPEAWARFQAAQRESLAGESRRRDIDKRVK